MKTQEDRELDRLGRKRGEDEEDPPSEFTLGTGSLLGIFLVLVLICGVFFGLGFTMGRRSSTKSAATVAPAASPAEQLSAAVKDSPGAAVFDDSQASPSQNGPTADTSGEAAASTPATVPEASAKPTPLSPKQPSAPGQAAVPTPAPHTPVMTLPVAETPLERQMEGSPRIVAHKATKPVAAAPAATSAAPAAAPSAPVAKPAAAGHYMVQVAAVARTEDANILASALRQRGYSATVRHEPYDKLLHVQIGPFSTRAEANATRSKLISDGYNAFLKP